MAGVLDKLNLDEEEEDEPEEELDTDHHSSEPSSSHDDPAEKLVRSPQSVPSDRLILPLLADLQVLKRHLTQLQEKRSAAHAELRAFHGEVTIPLQPRQPLPKSLEQSAASLQQDESQGAVPSWKAKYCGRMSEAVPSSLADALVNGDVALLRGTWLAKFGGRYNSDQPLPRRQDLPRGALWEPGELFVRDEPAAATGEARARRPLAEPGQPGPGGWLRALGTRGIEIVALSHCWATADHPDPDMEKLRFLTHAVHLFLSDIHDDLRQDIAFFIDWCCLYQAPRTPEQEAAYQRSLKNAALWYAHQGVTVWILPSPSEISSAAGRMYDNISGRIYDERGWPCFERALAELIKGPESIINLASLRAPAAGGRHVGDPLYRRAPLNPAMFRTTMLRKKLTKESDRQLLVEQYTEVFVEIMGGVKSLQYNELEWEDPQVEQLSMTLSWCHKLENLVLKHNEFSSLVALSAGLASVPTLRKLDLSENQIHDLAPLANALRSHKSLEYLHLEANDIEDVASLSEGLRDNKSLQWLSLDSNRIADIEPLAKCLLQNSTLRRLSLACNDIVEIGCLGGVLEVNSAMVSLKLTHNHIHDISPIAEALKKNSTLLELHLSENLISNATSLDSLKENSTLESLHLKKNGISDVSVFSTCLAENNSLKDLMLDDNPVSDWKPLLKGLTSNTSLHCLGVGNGHKANVLSLLGRDKRTDLQIM